MDGLHRTMESVCSQSFKDFEWIVIDGGSTDGSKDLLERNDEHIDYWVSEPDKGIYNAMNKGIAKAKGDFCQFLNSGDYFISPDTLKNVFSDNQLYDVNYGDQWCVQNGKVVEKRTYPQKMSLDYLFRAPLGHQASFFRTSVLKSHPYHEEYSISGDRALFLELYVNGFSFKHMPIPVVYFDTEGIGSNVKTLKERQKQFGQIKRSLFSEQVIGDIEQLMYEADNYKFVCRVTPLRWLYQFMRKIQQLRDSIK